jgi:hypothetical protein
MSQFEPPAENPGARAIALEYIDPDTGVEARSYSVRDASVLDGISGDIQQYFATWGAYDYFTVRPPLLLGIHGEVLLGRGHCGCLQMMSVGNHAQT